MRPVQLPRDEQAHLYPFEWWYFVGHLATADSGPVHELAFETTVVRAAGPLGLAHAWLAVFSFIDVTRGQYRTYDRFAHPLAYREHGEGFTFTFHPLASSTWSVLDSLRAAFAGETWRIGREPVGRYRIEVAHDGDALDLVLAPTKPAALLGDRGVMRYGDRETLAYYVRSRLDAQGEATIDGARRTVRGRAWMDRQWGRARVWRYRWKFLAVQLDDGHDLVVFRVHDKTDGSLVQRYGALVDPAGTMWPIDPAELVVEDRDPRFVHGEVEYPTRTHVEVASLGLALDVEPEIEDQRRRTANAWQPMPVWWEGACRVSGTLGGAPAVGKAFTELAGYEPFVGFGPPRRP